MGQTLDFGSRAPSHVLLEPNIRAYHVQIQWDLEFLGYFHVMKPTGRYIAKANGPRKYRSWYTCNYMDLSDNQTDFFFICLRITYFLIRVGQFKIGSLCIVHVDLNLKQYSCLSLPSASL